MTTETKLLIYELIIKTRECSNSYKKFENDKVCFYFYDGTIIKLNKFESEYFIKITYLLVSEFGAVKNVTNKELREFILNKEL